MIVPKVIWMSDIILHIPKALVLHKYSCIKIHTYEDYNIIYFFITLHPDFPKGYGKKVFMNVRGQNYNAII